MIPARNRLSGSAFSADLDKSGQILDKCVGRGPDMTSVPQSEVPQNPFLWTRGIAARETLRYLDRNGVDAEPVLLRAEL
jgi:hypothetical protein